MVEVKEVITKKRRAKSTEKSRKGNGNINYANLVPTPVVAMDKEFNVTYINEAGAGAVGSTPESCIGRKCYDLFKTPDCNTSNCRCAMAMQQDGTYTGDTIANLPSGELPIRYTGTPLKDDKGNIVGALEFVLDISKEMEITHGINELVTATVEGKLDTRAVKRFSNFSYSCRV